MNDDDLRRRLQRLEDIEAIKQLKASYCYLIDDGEIDRLMERFTSDAVWDGGPMGRFEGREAIREFLKALPSQLSFALHWVLNPRIEIDGDAARGTWYLVEPCTAARGERAIWGAGRYEERYERVDGEWRFREVRLIPIFWTPYEEGWSRRRSVLERS
jgi:ketosteroid isomerase-like protein